MDFIVDKDFIKQKREEWNPAKWEGEENPHMKTIMLGLAEHFYNLPEEEFVQYLFEAYGEE